MKKFLIGMCAFAIIAIFSLPNPVFAVPPLWRVIASIEDSIVNLTSEVHDNAYNITDLESTVSGLGTDLNSLEESVQVEGAGNIAFSSFDRSDHYHVLLMDGSVYETDSWNWGTWTAVSKYDITTAGLAVDDIASWDLDYLVDADGDIWHYSEYTSSWSETTSP